MRRHLVGNDYDRLPATTVIHWFRADRPGQARGIPDIMPALPLFAQLRRFTLAVIAAAETAADFAGMLYTDAPANGEADSAEPIEPIELEKRALRDDARRLEDEPDQGRAAGDDLRRVQERDSQRDRPLPEHAVQRRGRQFVGLQLRLRSAGPPDLFQVASASSRRTSSASCSTAFLPPGSTRPFSFQASCPQACGPIRRMAPPVVLGRPGARRSGQGSDRPGHAALRTTRPRSPTNTPAKGATGRKRCVSGPLKSSSMRELGLESAARAGPGSTTSRRNGEQP